MPRRPAPQRWSTRQNAPATIPAKAASPPKCPGDHSRKGSQPAKMPRRPLPGRIWTRQSAVVCLTRAFWPVEVGRLPGPGPFWSAKVVRGRGGAHPFVRARDPYTVRPVANGPPKCPGEAPTGGSKPAKMPRGGADRWLKAGQNAPGRCRPVADGPPKCFGEASPGDFGGVALQARGLRSRFARTTNRPTPTCALTDPLSPPFVLGPSKS